MIPIVASDTGLTSEAKAAPKRGDRAARAGGAEHLADLPALLQRDQERRLPAGQLHADVLELGGEIAGLPPQVCDLLPRGGGIAVEQPQARPGRLRPAADALERALPVGADRHQLRPHFVAADHRQPHRGSPLSHNPDLSCSLIALTATASIAGRISAATSGLTPERLRQRHRRAEVPADHRPRHHPELPAELERQVPDPGALDAPRRVHDRGAVGAASRLPSGPSHAAQ